MIMKYLLVLPALMFPSLTVAQELTHPTKMDLPESVFSRPDPSDYQISLDNGLTAYIARADQVPLVTLSAFIRAGKVSDEKEGSAEVLLDALLDGGPEGQSPEEFKGVLRLMAAEFSVEMHDEWTEISLNIPKEDLDIALPIFSALIRSPAVTDAALANVSGKAEAEIGAVEALSLSSATFALAEAVERFYEVLYADHPYGRRPTVEDFSNLTVDDVKDFHEKFFVPGNMTLAIAGDINEAEVRASVRDLFGDMRATQAPPPRQMPAIEFEKAAQHTFPVKKLQSWLVIGHELPVVPLEDQAALDVMNYILAAEHLHARMLTNTRVLYGYTNDASGFLEDRWFGPGSYTFRSYSRPEVIRPLYEEMMSAIRSIQTEEVTAEELFIAKGALRDGTFPIRYLDGYSTARDFAIEWLRYGNHSRSASYTHRVGAVTAKDVFDMANKYMRTRSMQIVLVGEPASLME